MSTSPPRRCVHWSGSRVAVPTVCEEVVHGRRGSAAEGPRPRRDHDASPRPCRRWSSSRSTGRRRPPTRRMRFVPGGAGRTAARERRRAGAGARLDDEGVPERLDGERLAVRDVAGLLATGRLACRAGPPRMPPEFMNATTASPKPRVVGGVEHARRRSRRPSAARPLRSCDRASLRADVRGDRADDAIGDRRRNLRCTGRSGVMPVSAATSASRSCCRWR